MFKHKLLLGGGIAIAIIGCEAVPEAKFVQNKVEPVLTAVDVDKSLVQSDWVFGPKCDDCDDLLGIECWVVEGYYTLPEWWQIAQDYTGPVPTPDLDGDPYELCANYPPVCWSICNSNLVPGIPNLREFYGDCDGDCDIDAADIAIWESLGGTP
jgi:hypothetical protein